jgi:hypothetical protein
MPVIARFIFNRRHLAITDWNLDGLDDIAGGSPSGSESQFAVYYNDLTDPSEYLGPALLPNTYTDVFPFVLRPGMPPGILVQYPIIVYRNIGH